MMKRVLPLLALLVAGLEIRAEEPKKLLNVAYGGHPRQVLDFYPAKSNKPTPVVFYIHGVGSGRVGPSSRTRLAPAGWVGPRRALHRLYLVPPETEGLTSDLVLPFGDVRFSDASEKRGNVPTLLRRVQFFWLRPIKKQGVFANSLPAGWIKNWPKTASAQPEKLHPSRSVAKSPPTGSCVRILSNRAQVKADSPSSV
jgi:hypothetical protein